MTLREGMKVEVYRNLRNGRATKPLYSIRYQSRVIARRHQVLLSGATFIVRDAGRQRVLREKRKNVHAFVRGRWVGRKGIFGIDAKSPKDFPVRMAYNPYVSDRFYILSVPAVQPVTGARGVLLNERGMSACYLT